MNNIKSKNGIIFSFVFLMLFILSFKTYGQAKVTEKDPENSINLNAATLFYIGMYSMDYERSIFSSYQYKLALDAGFGGWYSTTILKWSSGYSIPISINSLIGSGNNYFEIDVGARYTFLREGSDKSVSPYFPVFNIGYRYQRSDGKGLIFRSFLGLSGLGLGIGKAF
jgi:hypothetical protein